MDEQSVESGEDVVFATSSDDSIMTRNQSNSDTVEDQTSEIFSEDVTNQLVESLLGSSSGGNAARNYDSYDRMEGCSSDEENQTDNDDDNSVEKEEDTMLEHHYTELQNDIPDFGQFTAAPLNTLENSTADICRSDVGVDYATSSPLGFDDRLHEIGIDSDRALVKSDHHINESALLSSPNKVESHRDDESQCYVSIPPLTADKIAIIKKAMEGFTLKAPTKGRFSSNA